jgi:hypothetical protein
MLGGLVGVGISVALARLATVSVFGRDLYDGHAVLDHRGLAFPPLSACFRHLPGIRASRLNHRTRHE